jgi:signal transduction histidine kinase
VADDFSRLVSLACHDLRTPLATVSGFAKTMLRMDELEDDKRDRYLGLIDTSADELAELLDLLSLAARIEGGRYDPVVRSSARSSRWNERPRATAVSRRPLQSTAPESRSSR